MKSSLMIFLLMILIASCAHKKMPKETYSPVVSFQEANSNFQGQVQLPKEFKERLPLVIIVHEWWGKTAYIEKRAQMLTAEGFAALPVDLFGDGKTVAHPKDAQALATPFYQNPELGINRLTRYIEIAKNDPHVDPKRIYVIGYCFGGSQALNLARSGAEIKGVVSFHGNLASSYKAKDIKADILVLNGAADSMVPPKDVKAFDQEMKDAKATHQVINYQGATHAFTNPEATATGNKYNIPIAYDKLADEDSWKEMLKFLRK